MAATIKNLGRSARGGSWLVAAGVVLGTSLSAAAADAGECASDADCGAGWSCVKGVSVPGCASPPDCPPQDPVEDPTGFCERDPIRCSTDADCPDYLRCVGSGKGSCTATPDGGTMCGPVDPGGRACEFVPIECVADSQCPDRFACTEIQIDDCPPVECPPGEACDPGACAPTTERLCLPRQIACAADADCPTDWACVTYGCDDDAVAPVDTDGGGAAPQCETSRLCAPPFFDDGDLGGDAFATGEGGGAKRAAGGGPSRGAGSSDDGGCSVAVPVGRVPAVFGLLLAGAAVALGRRRRRR